MERTDWLLSMITAFPDAPIPEPNWSAIAATTNGSLQSLAALPGILISAMADILPPEMIEGMRQSPEWPIMEAVAPTLAYENAVMGDGAMPV
jgi:hypothetical protein